MIATEGALWGSIKAHGFLTNTVIVSDDAGQFDVGQHALCWVQYLEFDLILGIPPSMPMYWGFEPAWTPDKFRASRRGGACTVALLQSGTDLATIRDYLGYASLATTSRTLGDQPEDEARRPSNLLEACWKSKRDLLALLRSL